MVPCNKIKTLGLFILIAFLFIPIASAAPDVGNIKEPTYFKAPENSASDEDLFSELSKNVELYNEHFDKVPQIVKRLVGSEEIKGEIELENGEMLYVTFLMSGGKVYKFYKYDTSEDPNSKFGPSMTVKTNEETIRKTLDSNEPLKETAKGMDDGTFNVEAEGFFRKVMLLTFKNYINNLE